jgi:hypothetical protein
LAQVAALLLVMTPLRQFGGMKRLWVNAMPGETLICFHILPS